MMPLLEWEQTFPEAPEWGSQPSSLVRVTCSLCRYAKGKSFLHKNHLSSWASHSSLLSPVSTTPMRALLSSELCMFNWKTLIWPVSSFEQLNVTRIPMLEFAAPLWGGVGKTVLPELYCETKTKCFLLFRHSLFEWLRHLVLCGVYTAPAFLNLRLLSLR